MVLTPERLYPLNDQNESPIIRLSFARKIGWPTFQNDLSLDPISTTENRLQQHKKCRLSVAEILTI